MKVRPKVYWVMLAARLNGKKRECSVTAGDVACKSKLAYGRTISIVGPPVSEFSIVNVILGFMARSVWCVVSLTQYTSSVLFHTSPNCSSKVRHDSIGRYMNGWVESMNAKIGDGSNEVID